MPDETWVSIGQAKRDISQLVNRVASSGERILVTVRGEPVAALVSMSDYQWLVRAKDSSETAWRAWLDANAGQSVKILKRRGGAALDVDEIWRASREDLEERDAAGRERPPGLSQLRAE